MTIPDEILKKGITQHVSIPLEFHYNPETKQLKLTYFQGMMSSHKAVPLHLVFDASSSRQLLCAAAALAQALEIDVSEETTITYS